MGLMNRILDRSVLFSFDRSGFKRHQRGFDRSDLEVSMRGKVCLVTGANSGLGLATAEGLAERGATVHLICRSEERGAEAREEVTRATGNPEVHLDIVDISRPGSVRDFVQGLDDRQVDVLIHNAGVLPLEREVTPEGYELTVATHIVGPFLLTRLLRPRLHDSRVIFVSSGGMYTKRFDLKQMLARDGRYDGVSAYAMTKRAQVILSELWAEELRSTRTVVNAMHPGWAATPGVERSLPGFWRVMNSRLRTPAEGADTALWLAAARKGGEETGKLWFDRRAVPTHLVPWTREAAGERLSLWRWCEEVSRK
jgi:NAD(P)-dependent dehydrogenase (short-subunit alcohol dehydrogenase family)